MNLSELQKWDLRFIELAKHISSWSKDPSTQVGAVIVDDRYVVRGMGYNGFPRGVKDSSDRYAIRELKYQYIVHAELNAILNAHDSVEGCSIYVWPTLMFPVTCPECCKSVIQSGIVEVVSYIQETTPRWHSMADISHAMLSEAGVRMRGIECHR